MRTVERTAPDATWTIGGEVILPAAPGTYALFVLGKSYQRRAVVGWQIDSDGVRPLIAGDHDLVRMWLGANAVEHPDSRVESLTSGLDWPSVEAWWAD